ncbi:MAG: ankyrin repeat domain-containing protein [Hyphomicrobium aestuarii]|nr:ankyrin repeat domain-containing protein [Hyphomicrobium aestuarii]
MQSVDFEKEFDRLVGISTKESSDALLNELYLLKDWPTQKLSELLQQLTWLGGNRWPSALAELGADLNFVDDEGQTALSICVHAACRFGGQAPVDTFTTACELLKLGASPNSRYLSMFSVTRLAFLHDLRDLTTLFLLAGADLDLEEPDSQYDMTLRDEMLASDKEWVRRLVLTASGSSQD